MALAVGKPQRDRRHFGSQPTAKVGRCSCFPSSIRYFSIPSFECCFPPFYPPSFPPAVLLGRLCKWTKGNANGTTRKKTADGTGGGGEGIAIATAHWFASAQQEKSGFTCRGVLVPDSTKPADASSSSIHSVGSCRFHRIDTIEFGLRGQPPNTPRPERDDAGQRF